MENRFLFSYLLILSVLGGSNAFSAQRVALLVNEGFQIDEYRIPMKLFEEAGLEVTIAGPFIGTVQPGRKYQGQGSAEAKITYDSIDPNRFDSIILIGGAGAWKDFFPNKDVHRLIRKAFKTKKLVGLLCAATGILATVDNLDGKSTPIAKGKHVTGYHQVEGLLTLLGQVNYDPGIKGQPYVVVDGNLVTGRDPESSEIFARTVIKQLKNKK